ncbi:hypothetical protein C0993_011900 [Termitomyces sp. T159_Od127]|nr:hypothetical protein C0993_011900 [Termitomyces sp. T159_Od127]
MSRRPATPPIIDDPTDNDDGQHYLDWYDDEYAGGYVLPFGKHAGQKIHKTSITYLYWCNRTLDKKRYDPTIRAIQAFHTGLQRYAETNYGDFRFPFGQYRGMKISECPDDYLLWANGQPHITSKYGIFFEAVTRWLARPSEEKEGPSEASHLKEGKNTVNARDLAEKDLVDSPSKSSSQTRVLHVGLIKPEGKKLSDVRKQQDLDSGQSKSMSEPKSKAESESSEHLTLSVRLQEEHYETRNHAPRRSTTVLKLQITELEESRPSVIQQNERKLKELEKAQAGARRGKDAIGNPIGKWFRKPSANVT